MQNKCQVKYLNRIGKIAPFTRQYMLWFLKNMECQHRQSNIYPCSIYPQVYFHKRLKGGTVTVSEGHYLEVVVEVYYNLHQLKLNSALLPKYEK